MRRLMSISSAPGEVVFASRVGPGLGVAVGEAAKIWPRCHDNRGGNVLRLPGLGSCKYSSLD